MADEESRVGVPGEELRMPQHRHQQIAVGAQPVDRAEARAPASIRAAAVRSGPHATTLANIGS
jgi:hypothetical protein